MQVVFVEFNPLQNYKVVIILIWFLLTVNKNSFHFLFSFFFFTICLFLLQESATFQRKIIRANLLNIK
jgi:multisubunit Na+/H+ antiporter MnhE subunit